MSQLKTVSKFKTFNRILYIFGILFFCFLSFLSFSKYNPNQANTFPNLIPGIVFILFALFVFYCITSLPTIYAYSDKIELHRHLGLSKRTVFFSEIENYITIPKESKYGNYEELYLTLNNKEVIKLNSYDYANFQEIQADIIRNKPKNIALEKQLDKKENIKYSSIFLIIGVLFIYIACQFYKDTSLTRNDVCVIKEKLADDIKLERSNKSRSLVFKLENLSDFKFKIGSLALKETYYEDLMSDFKKGDLIYLTIEKDQYQKKISKKTPMSVVDEYFHYEKIDVVEVENKTFKYLSLSDYNKVNRQNDYWGIGFFGFFGIALTIAGICIYLKSTRNLKVTQSHKTTKH